MSARGPHAGRPTRALWRLALLALAVSGCGEAARRPPCIFVIAVDAASAFYFGVYGDPSGATPNVDRFAQGGVVFEQAYSQSATTVSSTASLLTGVRGTTHHMTGYTRLPANLPTLPERLDALGFRTQGFVANPFAGAEKLGLARGYGEMVQVYALPEVSGGRRPDASVHFVVSTPQDVDDQVFARLPKMKTALSEGSPLFTYIHFLQPHKPYDPPEEHLRPFAAGEVPGGWDALHAEFERANRTGSAAPETIARIEARYRANLHFVDAGIGRLFERLAQEGLYDDSLIVLLGDHGDAFFHHHQFGHNTTLYDDMVRIPLIFKFPARDGIRPARLAELVETVDVAPTLLDYVGAKLPPELEGDSLMPLIRGQARQLAHPEVVLSTQMNDVHAIRVGDLKYILRLPDREELYDLRSDPDEQHNLVASEPEQARALRERLAAFVRPGARGSRPPDNRLREDPRMNELLERLGYAEEAPAPDGGAEAPQR